MTGYEVLVDDNFHYMDEESRYKLGSFATYDEALTKAKAIVDDFLRENYSPGMTSKELYEGYVGFGEDPFIIPAGDPRFSAWEYARERCAELCRDEDAVASILRHPGWPEELKWFVDVLVACLGRADTGMKERRSLEAFQRAVDRYPDAMPADNTWYWLRLERESTAYTVYIYADRFELHGTGALPKDVEWVVRFRGSGRRDARVGDIGAALAGMRMAALSPDYVLKASGG
ncbi:MAG TPA: hypothetical protein VE398_08025 [Acidobacteriota bacterium]|nr:hypothetical protein [Acidobacteriota bacterium]